MEQQKCQIQEKWTSSFESGIQFSQLDKKSLLLVLFSNWLNFIRKVPTINFSTNSKSFKVVRFFLENWEFFKKK